MQTQAITLNQLHVSPLNMRAERKEPSLKKMAAIAAIFLRLGSLRSARILRGETCS